MSGGATVLEPGNAAFATGKVEVTGNYERLTQFQIRASRDVAPAFFGTGGALISTAASVYIEHRIARDLSLIGNGNFGYSETSPTKDARYNSYSASGKLRYTIARDTFATLSYEYSYFNLTSIGTPFLIERNVVMLSIEAKWK
jgi:hypothetical protein